MLASAGQGYLRGIGDLKTPLVILVVAHSVNVVLELLFVYGFGWGLAGSAWGTVIAQLGMGAAFFAVALPRRLAAARSRAHARAHARRAARSPCGRPRCSASFLVASAVLARVGSASLGAHQIAFQLFIFLALVLDALAIAAQVIVGRMLGAGDAAGARAAARADDPLVGRARRARSASSCSRSATPIPRLFTGDDAVVARRTRSGGCSPR